MSPRATLASVEAKEAGSPDGIWRSDLDCGVHTSGTFGQGTLQDVDPVGGQQEGHVDVVIEPVDLIQDLEEKRARPKWPERAIRGDEIDVLHDHDRWLQQPCKAAHLSNERERLAREDEGRDVAPLGEKVTNGVRLSCSGWPVKKDSAL